MRLIFIIILFIFTNSIRMPDRGRWVIDSNSRLFIHGLTNVNSFTCSMDCSSNYDTLEYAENTKGCDLIFYKNKMIIPVDNFNCGNKLITNDFLKTIKAEKYPNLDIRFISLEKLNGSPIVTGVVEITLTGVTKRYTITYNTKELAKNSFQLKGKQPVCFADFGLHPPQHMLGLIQVQEALEVEFNLILKSL